MNKSLIKFIADFGPLLIFFYFYKKFGMNEAILPLIIATLIATGVLYFFEKKIPKGTNNRRDISCSFWRINFIF